MKVKLNKKINETNLTLSQVYRRFIHDYTTEEWRKTSLLMLRKLNPDNGTWVWVNANLEFIRTGDVYTVRSII